MDDDTKQTSGQENEEAATEQDTQGQGFLYPAGTGGDGLFSNNRLATGDVSAGGGREAGPGASARIAGEGRDVSVTRQDP